MENIIKEIVEVYKACDLTADFQDVDNSLVNTNLCTTLQTSILNEEFFSSNSLMPVVQNKES